MATTSEVHVDALSLDLHNFRTVAQPSETEAIRALISINPDWFWALMESLLDDGYLPTDNIIGINDATGATTTVKEGNRRIASLKLILGLTDGSQLGIPSDIQARISGITQEWRTANSSVPCTVYEHLDIDLVNKIVNRAHGKNERAGRFPWPSVAKARYNRDISGAAENGLTLLEKYLSAGRNVTAQQKERWAGDYQISILDAAISKVAPRLGATNSSDLTSRYPNLPLRDALENMISGIGLKQVTFDDIRSTQIDFAAQFGIPPLNTSSTGSTGSTGNQSSGSNSSGQSNNNQSQSSTGSTGSQSAGSNTSGSSGDAAGTSSSGSTGAGSSTGNSGTVASATNTPRSVKNKMRSFHPVGNNREKVVDLKNEILQLTIDKSPIAFSFLLRSLFEISAKVYCSEQNIATTYTSGRNTYDRKLIELLTDATNHLTQHNTNQPMVRLLHGALTQLSNQHSILSVTSMNQLVHNPHFSVAVGDVCVLFHNIYPLLDAMN